MCTNDFYVTEKITQCEQVKIWDNRTPPVHKQRVLETDGKVEDPFVAFDRYDDRSLIENNLFRDTNRTGISRILPKQMRKRLCADLYGDGDEDPD